jgi:hypothetical protein
MTPSPLHTRQQLVDQFGRLAVKGQHQPSQPVPGYGGFFQSAEQTRGQISRPVWVTDTRRYMTEGSRYVMMGISRWLYWNTWIGGVIDERARDVVGNAWNLKYQGENKNWGAATENWFNNHHKDQAEFSGRLDWRTQLRCKVRELHVDGDGFGMTAAHPGTKYPAVQHIPSHRVGMRWDPSTIGGAICDENGTILKWRISRDDTSKPLSGLV